ncbi:MAG: RNA methyltransferase [Dysgonamonadaceae bacterium]|jgi:TrmH family RNA methyltransferase|nr:RNA methyltransferase [Dysgonamonadaceae bacterium]
MPLSKSKIKYIQSLRDKKHRLAQGVFVAEGVKLVSDLLQSCRCQFVAALPEIAESLRISPGVETIVASEDELKKASFLKTPPQVIGVFYQLPDEISPDDLSRNLHLVLDGVQDPGNMGTIVRLADWFGIGHLFCSPDTADIYNPKTVQATMGAIARVKIHYTDIADLLADNPEMPIYGTFLDGNDIYREELSNSGFIVMGSEGGGISPSVEKLVTSRLFIPNYPFGRDTSESLNVASATAIVCSEFRRRNFRQA